jgi:two-component system response regulator
MSGERVLLIDDDPVAQEVIAGVLKSGGYLVSTLDSPIGATRTIRDAKIELVLCDLNMPAMRGDAFARMFRKSSLLQKVKLIVTSAAPDGELERLLDEGVVDGVIHKRDLAQRLLPLVRKLLGRVGG